MPNDWRDSWYNTVVVRFVPKADILRCGTAARRLCRPFDLAQISNHREADKLVPKYLTSGGRTLSGEDHFDDWRHLDVVVIKCDGARKVGGRALRSRPKELVPRCSTGKRQPPELHEGAHPRCLTSMLSEAR